MLYKDEQTQKATKLLLSFLVDNKRLKTQKQATKSVCLMLQNQKIAKMPVLLTQVQSLVQDSISEDAMAEVNSHQKHLQLLNFLAAALQVMPEESCCDTTTKITRLIDSSVIDQVKT